MRGLRVEERLQETILLRVINLRRLSQTIPEHAGATRERHDYLPRCSMSAQTDCPRYPAFPFVGTGGKVRPVHGRSEP